MRCCNSGGLVDDDDVARSGVLRVQAVVDLISTPITGLCKSSRDQFPTSCPLLTLFRHHFLAGPLGLGLTTWKIVFLLPSLEHV